MEEERKLSEVFEEICKQSDEGNGSVRLKDDCMFNKVIKILKFKFNLLTDSRLATIDSVDEIFDITEEFTLEKDYIKEFLLMCEYLLYEKDKYVINIFTQKKFQELARKNVIKVFYGKNYTILSYNLINKLSLEEIYHNLDYKIGGISTMSTTINNGVTFNHSDVTNSGIISGANSTNNLEINSTITNENIEDVVRAIHTLISNDSNISNDLKDELYDNRKDTSKLKSILSNIGTLTSNVAVGILTQACLTQLGL